VNQIYLTAAKAFSHTTPPCIRSVESTLATASSKSSCVTWTRRSRSAYMPASVQTPYDTSYCTGIENELVRTISQSDITHHFRHQFFLGLDAQMAEYCIYPQINILLPLQHLKFFGLVQDIDKSKAVTSPCRSFTFFKMDVKQNLFVKYVPVTANNCTWIRTEDTDNIYCTFLQLTVNWVIIIDKTILSSLLVTILF